jgi:lysophospholipase L1-like esterase
MRRSLITGLYLILIAITVVDAGCKKSTVTGPPATPAPPPVTTGPAKKWLALGDSYTIGQNVQATERFPYLATVSLRSQGIDAGDPVYIATTGWTTANLQSAINAQSPLGVFDIVTLLIGVNDQYQGVDTSVYRNRFSQLLQKSVELASGKASHVFVLSIPDYSATPFVSASSKPRVSKEIDQFNAINKQITLSQGIAYIDITPLTREVVNDPSLLANDGLHYSAKEHRLWADLLVPLLKPVLQ